MQNIKNFLKRNAPIFIFGLIIALIFVIITLLQPRTQKTTPGSFKKVEEEVFKEEPPKEEPKTQTQYAPQTPSPENIGKPYFYGEYDPTLRDEQGYPIPPKPGSTPIPPYANSTDVEMIRNLELEVYKKRTAPVYINFTDELGFQPSDASAFTGTRIIWTNKTDHEIFIEQTLPIHDALKNGIRLGPGESFEFRPLLDRFFSYVEYYSKSYGTISIGDTTRPLVENWNPE